MSLNGISTLPDKNDRKLAKLALAQTKRQQTGQVSYRPLNVYDLALTWPTIGRPWKAGV